MIWEQSIRKLVIFNFLTGSASGFLSFDVGLIQIFPMDFFHNGNLFFSAKLEFDFFVDDGPNKIFTNLFTGLFFNVVIMGGKKFFYLVSHSFDNNFFNYIFNFEVLVLKWLK
jgi:hypothetical protein